MSGRWDDEEKLNGMIHQLIDFIFSHESSHLTKEERLDHIHLIRANIINRYTRIKEIEIDLSDKEAFDKFYNSIIRSQHSKADKKQADFACFAIGEYGIEITREYIRKFSDEELILIEKRLEGEISDKEFTKQLAQLQHPTLEDKKNYVEYDIEKQLDYIERTQGDEALMRPEVVARMRKNLEGYEDAPDMYRMARVFVHEAALGQEWDEAEIEKVLAEQVEEMLKDGRINNKEYAQIKRIVKRETEKKVQRG